MLVTGLKPGDVFTRFKRTLAMSDSTLSRRDFLQRAAVLGVAAAGAGAFLAACEKKDGGAAAPGGAPAPGAPKAASALSCEDVSGLTEPQKATRTNNNYIEKTTTAGQDCANCALFTQPKEEGGCGGCAVVAGPINPAGWCKLWVAKA